MSGLNADNHGTSTRPYLLRALHDWCTDNGFTPYVAVHVGAGVRVPMEYVKNNEIVLNVSFEATSGLKLGNEFIEFRARFGGATRDIQVPVDHVVAIYARENGQGMAFPTPTLSGEGTDAAVSTPAPETATEAPASGAAAPRGLRLASSEAAGDASSRAASVPTDGDEPEPSPPAGRPSLKRIK